MNGRAVELFFKKHKMHPDQVDVDLLTETFIAQITRGLAETPENGLAIYPSYIDITELHCFDRPRRIVAIDAGGTHMRIAKVVISDRRNVIIESLDKFDMIGRHAPLSAEEFFIEFAQQIAPYSENSDAFGISFAFPGKITETHDMIVRDMAKEIVVYGVGGQSLRQQLTDKIHMISGNRVPIVVVNDSVASLLSATIHYDHQEYTSVTGLILGTGTNSCYCEAAQNVKKIKYPHPVKTDLINTESGCFDGYRGGSFDAELDLSSEIPNDHLFEKMVGGKYLGELTEIACMHAVREGLISAAYDLSALKNATAKEISSILNAKPTNRDQEAVYTIAQTIVKRAETLLCANLAALIRVQHGYGKSALMSIEGSTVQNVPNFRQSLIHKIQKQTGTNIATVSTDHAVLLGAAWAASYHLSKATEI